MQSSIIQLALVSALYRQSVAASPNLPSASVKLKPQVFVDPSGFSVRAVLAPASNNSETFVRRAEGPWAAADTDHE